MTLEPSSRKLNNFDGLPTKQDTSKLTQLIWLKESHLKQNPARDSRLIYSDSEEEKKEEYDFVEAWPSYNRKINLNAGRSSIFNVGQSPRKN